MQHPPRIPQDQFRLVRFVWLVWALVAWALALGCATPGVDPLADTIALDCPARSEKQLFRPIERVRGWAPQSALCLRLQTSVTLEGGIDGDGRVVAPRISEPSASRMLDQAALEAFSFWRYCPELAEHVSPDGGVTVRFSFDASNAGQLAEFRCSRDSVY